MGITIYNPTYLPGGQLTTHQEDSLRYNPLDGLFYTVTVDSVDPSNKGGLRRYRWSNTALTFTELSQVVVDGTGQISEIFPSSAVELSKHTGNFYGQTDGGNSSPLRRFSLSTGVTAATFGTNNTSTSNSDTNLTTSDLIRASLDSSGNEFVLCVGIFGGRFSVISSSLVSPAWTNSGPDETGSVSVIYPHTPSASGNPRWLFQLEHSNNATDPISLRMVEKTGSGSTGLTFSTLISISKADLNTLAGGTFSVARWVWDPYNQSPILILAGGTNDVVRAYNADLVTTRWQTTLPASQLSLGSDVTLGVYDTHNHLLVFGDNNHAFVMDLRNGTILDNGSGSSSSNFQSSYFDYDTMTLFGGADSSTAPLVLKFTTTILPLEEVQVSQPANIDFVGVNAIRLRAPNVTGVVNNAFTVLQTQLADYLDRDDAGSITDEFDMNQNQIKGMAQATLARDLVTKAQAETMAATV